MTRQQLILASLLAAWLSMVLACSGVTREEVKKKVDEADALWDRGDKTSAVDKYKVVYADRWAIPPEKEKILLRIVEFEVKAGNTDEAKKWINRGLDDKLTVKYTESASKELVAAVEKERQETAAEEARRKQEAAAEAERKAAEEAEVTRKAIQEKAEAEAARRYAEEHKAEVAPKAVAGQKASSPHSESPRPTVKLIPIKSYLAVDAWREASALKGQRVRLTGDAVVKRSVHGVYAAFSLPTGRRIATVAVKNDDAQPLLDIKVDEGALLSVNLETTVTGTGESGQLNLTDSEFLPLDAPEGFAALEEPPVETRKATTVKAGTSYPRPSVSAPSPDPAPPSASSPIYVGTGSKTVNVRGYYKNNGTYVRAYSRAAPGMGTHRRR